MTPDTHVIQRHLKAGEILFHEGQQTGSIYVVQIGEIQVFKTIENRKIILASKKKHQIFGELSFLKQGPHSATAMAVKTSIVMELNVEELKSFLEDQPTWHRILVKSLIDHLGQANRKIIQLTNELEKSAR